MAESKKYEWALPLGTTLNGGSYLYEVVEYLGQGGFGITYKVKTEVLVKNIAFNLFFAIKEYFPKSCWRGDNGITVQYSRALEDDMKSGLADFVTEGERLQRVCKLNTSIVSVNEVFQANNTAYYVMEYLEGGDLRDLIKNNGCGVSEAKMMSIMRPVAEAVQCLHDNNMLHLDIKPENIVMRYNNDALHDEPVLIDFGIAVHFDSKGNPTTKSPSAGVSAGYSPKEQYSSIRTFDPRYDIYAFSATCFYLLTGKDPIDSLNMSADFVGKELPQDLSESTASAIVRGMSLDKSGRQKSMQEFLSDLEPQHSLPVGAVIKGETCSYVISEVVTEERDYIQYIATLRNDDQSETLELAKRQDLQMMFDVWEWWLPSFKRQEQGVDTAGAVPPMDWWLPKEKTGLSMPGTSIKEYNGGTIAEVVEQNNTIYCIKQRAMMPRAHRGTGWFTTHRKSVVGAIVAIVVAAVLGVVAPIFFKSCSNSGDTGNAEDPSESLASSSWEFKTYVKGHDKKVDDRICSYTGHVDSQGRPSGDNGECDFKDGDFYRGQMSRGMMDGKGEYIYKSGNKFVGTLKNDHFLEGRLYDIKSKTYFEGTFKDDKPVKGEVRNIKDNKLVTVVGGGK